MYQETRKAGIVSKIPFGDAYLVDDFKKAMGKITNLIQMLEKMKSHQILDLVNGQLRTLCDHLQKLMNGSKDFDIDAVSQQSDQLSVHAASLPSINPRRDPMIQCAQLVKNIFLTGLCICELQHYVNFKIYVSVYALWIYILIQRPAAEHFSPENISQFNERGIERLQTSVTALHEFTMDRILVIAQMIGQGANPIDSANLCGFVNDMIAKATQKVRDWSIQHVAWHTWWV